MKSPFYLKSRMAIVYMAVMFSLLVVSSFAQTGLLREYWSGISGTAVSNLTGSTAYPNTPTSRDIISLFEGPTNLADSYGSRVRGYVVPPTTGSYTFWIAGDDNCELYLSTSSDPANKTLIASVPDWTNSREWTKYAQQQSQLISLVAGQKYYIEALHKEGTGGDNLAVGWQGPGITGDVERPIPGSRLVPYELGLLREVWTSVSGTAVSNLTASANYPNTPNVSETAYSFETATNYADNYGQRLRGYVVPPTTGSYTFWIASDDNAELWLSTGADPAGKALAASVTGYTNSREWTKFSSQQSTARTLTAGQKYYIEVLHKEGTGGDNLAVGWQGPGITGDAERPIPPSRLLKWTGGTQTYSLTMSNDGHGATTPSGTVTVNSGAATAISATPLGGYQFSGWSVTSGTATIANASSASTTVTLSSGNATVQANFTAITYTLTMSNDGYGATTPSGTVTVNSGAATAISATPLGGYQFSGWSVTSGTATIANASSASTTVTLSSGNATVRANFTAITYTLTMSNDGHGATTPSGTVTVNSGAATAISATPLGGYQFSGWSVTSGTATIANASSVSTTVTLSSGNATVQANFTAITYTLTMSNDGHGATTPSGTVTVNSGAATAISATPLGGYQFSGWSVTSGTATIANASSASTTVTLSSGNATIRANFTAITYTLTMSNDGHGTTTPSGTVTVNSGAATAISATPLGGYQFSGWSVTSGTATIANASSASTTVTLSSGNATIRANFTAITYTLTMSNDGHGTTTPSGTVTVNSGAATAISATPLGGYQFSGWSVTSGTATIANASSSSTTVTLSSGNATVRANFAQQFDTLTVSNNGNGSTVPSGPLAVGRGVAATISANANIGYHFTGWTILSGTAAIANPEAASTTVTLTAGNAAIRANFAQDLPVIPNNRQIAISGTLSDENGNPVGSSSPEAVEMAVRLCSQAVGGDTLYTEEFLARNNQAVTVDKGLFVARLGTGAAGSDLRTVVAANENLFAEITILGAQPDVLLPRTPVTAAPYSLGTTPAAALQDKTLHGQGNPADLSIDAAIGSYYVNDTDGTTWVKINNGWRRMD